MYFPLIERRIDPVDRRLQAPDRRQAEISHSSLNNRRNNTVRRNGIDRRVLKLDRETLLYASSILGKGPEKPEEKKSKAFLFCSTFLLPLTVAAVSVFATISINDQQVKSAENLAKGQQENAEKIANANIENSKTIADAEIKTQHLQHLVSIFSRIISPEKKENEKPEVRHELIRSLSVYADEALPFLLQIRQHFSKPRHDSLQQSQTWRIADDTIKSILGYSQLNLSHQTVISLSGTPRNLRNKQYVNYNLDDSHFTNVNLYKANFSGSSLQNSTFTSADLQETKFNNANSKGVIITKSNLRKTDFSNAYLAGVKFSPDCKYIEHAKFSLNTLLNLKTELFDSVKPDDYALLLMPHENELEAINKEEKSKLADVFTKLNINNFSELQKKFQELRNEGLAGIEHRPETAHQVSMNNL